MKLFIDDIRTPPDDTWHICRDVNSAIRALDMFWREITEINLDHDISHQVVMGDMSRPYPCPETFEAVARHIATMKKLNRSDDWKPKIHIHTSNPVGMEKMAEILKGFEVDKQRAVGANRLETIL